MSSTSRTPARPGAGIMASIRARYGVPARRGMRITFCGEPCTITGATRDGDHLRVRFDDDPKCTHTIHPTWEVAYPDPAPWVHVDGVRVADPRAAGAPQGGYTYLPREGYAGHGDSYVSTRHGEHSSKEQDR